MTQESTGRGAGDQTTRAVVDRWHGLMHRTTVAEVSAISGQSLQMIEHYSRQRDTRKAAGTAMRKWEQKT